MVKAILTTKEQSNYDDLPWERYHFPKTYLQQVQQALGDFIIYYEPRRKDTNLSSSGGRQSYFAVAQLDKISEDRVRSSHYYVSVKNYLRFDSPVPFKDDKFYFESILKKADGTTNKGAFGRSVRLIPDEEFDFILRSGFNPSNHKIDSEVDQPTVNSFNEEETEFQRPLIESTVKKKFRDAAFKRQIRDLYDRRCAITGMRLINGGGRPEIEAAHIKPVEADGPDAVQNGIALSRTAHWMFDRGLISIGDDMRILKSNSWDLGDAEKLLNDSGFLNLPQNSIFHPHKVFLEYHRENVFKE